MSSAKSSSGVHFYGRMYVGYDDRSEGRAADDESLEDGGNKSRLGVKFKENLGGGLQLIGNLEYKFDGIDGTSNDGADCSNGGDDCRTFNLHLETLVSRQVLATSVRVHMNLHTKLWGNLITT